MKQRGVLRFALLLVSCGVAPFARGAEVANWVGGDGLWSDATKWSGGVVPANNGGTTYTVNIDSGNAAASKVTLRGGAGSGNSIAIDALTVDGGDSLAVQNYTVSTGALTVNGLLDFGSFGTVNLPADATVGGAGTIRFSNGSTRLGVSTGTLTIEDGITINGGSGYDIYYSGFNSARVGGSGASLVSRGLIDARSMLIVSGSTIDNRGTFQASAGGQFVIDSNFSLDTIGNLVNDGGEFVITKTLQNVGQALRVDRPRGWVLAGGTVSGGTVSTSGSGYIYVPYLHTGTLTNVTLNGDVQVNGELHISGTFSGNGTIQIANPEAIEGSGVVRVNAVPAGVTIRGGHDASFEAPMKARIFASSNAGTIRAERSVFDGAGILRVAGTLTNSGRLEVSEGGTLHAENNLTFGNFGKLVADGGGLLEVVGYLDLATGADSLEVLPKKGGGAYDNHVIATYTGRLFGTFDGVTPGISVSYDTPNQIIISGIPLPEPGLTSLAMVTLALSGGARRRRRR